MVRATATNFMGVPSYINLPIAFLSYTLIAIFVFSSSISKRVLWGVISMGVVTFVNYVIVLIAAALPGTGFQTDYTQSIERLIMTLLYLLLEVTCFSLLLRIQSKEIELPRGLMFASIVLMLISVVAVSLLTRLVILSDGKSVEQFISLVTAVALLVISAGLTVSIQKSGVYLQQNTQIKTELEINRLEREHMENMVGTMQAMREWRHDFHNHMQLLSYYMKNEKWDDMRAYMADMVGEVEELSRFISTGNQAIDAILSSKELLARRHGITIQAACAVPASGLPLADMDLCVLVGTLVDNAIEACLAVEPDRRFIDLTIEPREGMLYVRLRNASRGEYRFDEKANLISSKAKERGLGLRNAQRMVEGAGGILSVEPTEDAFVVDLFLPLRIAQAA